MRRAKEIPQLENKRGNQFVHSVNSNLCSKCNRGIKKKKWKEIKRTQMQAQFMCSSAKWFLKKWKELNLAASTAHSFHSHTICFPPAWMNEVEIFFKIKLKNRFLPTLTFGLKVHPSMYCSPVTSTAQSVPSRQPGLFMSAVFYCRFVVAQSVHYQCLSQPLISRCSEVIRCCALPV